MRNVCSVSAPSVAFGATSPLRGRIAKYANENGGASPARALGLASPEGRAAAGVFGHARKVRAPRNDGAG